MNRDVEIGQVSIATFIEKDIVWLQVSAIQQLVSEGGLHRRGNGNTGE
jgi:hypothetical protein